MQWYPNDWLNDLGVLALSRHDRSVWFDLLMHMHHAERRGYLLVNGRAIPDEALARMLGLDLESFLATRAAILEAGVASLCPETGSLFSRRLVADQYLREVRAAAGKRGGRPAAKQTETKPKANPGDLLSPGRKQNAPPSSSSSSSSSILIKSRHHPAREADGAETEPPSGPGSPPSPPPTPSPVLPFPQPAAAVDPELGESKSKAKPFPGESKTEPLPEALPGNPAPTPSAEDLGPVVEQIILAHPRSRLRELKGGEIRYRDRTATVDAVLHEAARTGSSRTEAGWMILALVEAIARTVPRGEWHYLKEPSEFMLSRDYRIEPSHFSRQGGKQNASNPPYRQSDGTRVSPAIQRERESVDALARIAERRYGIRPAAAAAADDGAVPAAAAPGAVAGDVPGGVGGDGAAAWRKPVQGCVIEGDPQPATGTVHP